MAALHLLIVIYVYEDLPLTISQENINLMKQRQSLEKKTLDPGRRLIASAFNSERKNKVL